MHPNSSAASPNEGIVSPREIECFAASQLGSDHDLNMREQPILKIDGYTRIIRKFTHSYAP